MTDKILEVRGLTKTYGGVKKRGAKKADPTLDVLKGIDLDIYRGDVVCLIGPSGCGKSTFLRCLNRLETPTSGSIKFEGVEVNETHIDAVRQKMGMVFQHFNLFPHLTVKKNLELAPSLLKLKDKDAISARADELLARVGLADKANAYPKSLSGGQQQRIAIARALAMDPDVILFDEPTSALDPEMVKERPREAADLRELHADLLLQPLDIGADIFNIGVDERGIGAVLRHFHHVSAERLFRFVESLSLLKVGAPGGDTAGRENGVTGGPGHLFEHHRLQTAVKGLNRGDEASGARAENDAVKGFGRKRLIDVRLLGRGSFSCRSLSDTRGTRGRCRDTGFQPISPSQHTYLSMSEFLVL